MREADRYNGIAAICRGDEQGIREMRANIAVFARRLGDPATTRLVNDVLAGRRSVREVFRSHQFNAVGNAHVDNFLEGLDELSEEERERVLEPARAVAEDEAPPVTDQALLDTLRDADLPDSPVRDGEVEGVAEPVVERPPTTTRDGLWFG